MKGEGYHCIEEEATDKRDSIQRIGDYLPPGRDALRGCFHHQCRELFR